MNIKLTKETRDYVNVGTILKDSCAKYEVTCTWISGNGRCKYVSIKCLEDYVPNHEWMVGRTIYGEPLSKLYGMEIVKGESK